MNALEEQIRLAKEAYATWPQWMKDVAYIACTPPINTAEARIKEIERETIELCAKVCDKLDHDGIPFRGHLINVANADDCAAAIRTLATGTAQATEKQP